MKIQEMKSGSSHLHRKVQVTGRNNVFEMRPIGEAIFGEGVLLGSNSEMEEPIWSVISFSQRQAGGLTYKQASDLIAELDAYDVSGLCIVTDEAASRMRG